MSAGFVWLTGRRGAGKQTIGTAVADALRADGHPCALLDVEALSTHLAHGPTDGGRASLAWLGTSRTVSRGPAPLKSKSSRSAASSDIVFAVENGIAWRVN